MADFGITAEGVSIPRLIDYLDALADSYEQDTGIRLDLTDPENARDIQVRWAAYFAGNLDQLGQQNQALIDIIDPDSASGRQLTLLARIVGVLRVFNSFSTVTMTCTGTPGVTIIEGQVIVEGGGRGGVLARWISAESQTIPAGGSVDVSFIAEEAGAIPGPAGQITGVVTPVSGLDSVTNAADASVGIDEESDAALRIRMRQGRAARAGCGVPGVRSRILQLDYVQACTIIANGDSESKTVQGVVLPANSFLCVVLPNQLTPTQEEGILGVLYDSVLGTGRSAGTDVTGLVTNLEDGSEWDVGFDYGDDLTVTLGFTITTRNGAAERDARIALRTELAKLLPRDLGEQLLQLELKNAAWDTGLIATCEVLIQGVDADFSPLITQRITAFTTTVNGVDIDAD